MFPISQEITNAFQGVIESLRLAHNACVEGDYLAAEIYTQIAQGWCLSAQEYIKEKQGA